VNQQEDGPVAALLDVPSQALVLDEAGVLPSGPIGRDLGDVNIWNTGFRVWTWCFWRAAKKECGKGLEMRK
jgi:hypothetical protein